jgi:hypothetical protein
MGLVFFLMFVVSGLLYSVSSSLIIKLLFAILCVVIAYLSRKDSFNFLLNWKTVIWLGIIVFGLLFYEALKFDNYVYSRIHVIPDNFGIFAGTLTGLIFIPRNKNQSFLIYLLSLAVVAYGFLGVFKALGKSAANLAYWSHLPTGNAERSIRKMYGEDLKYIDFLNRSIPETARVVTPPASAAYRHTSDLWIMSSLLYPHQIVQFTSPQNLLPGDYVLISSEADNQRAQSTWPDFALTAATVVIYDWQADSGRIWPGPVDFQQSVPVANPWGYLILPR